MDLSRKEKHNICFRRDIHESKSRNRMSSARGCEFKRKVNFFEEIRPHPTLSARPAISLQSRHIWTGPGPRPGRENSNKMQMAGLVPWQTGVCRGEQAHQQRHPAPGRRSPVLPQKITLLGASLTSLTRITSPTGTKPAFKKLFLIIFKASGAISLA